MKATFKRFLADNQTIIDKAIDKARDNQNVTPLTTKRHRKTGQISRRQSAFIACRVAGYHDDARKFVRAYTENRISYQAAKDEWDKGVKMKQSGVVCTCFFCKQP